MVNYSKKDLLALTDSALDSAVKIQGTKFDRKRKFSQSEINKMSKMRANNETLASIASKLGCSITAVRYNLMTDAEKKAFNLTRDGKHYGNVSDMHERAEYKRKLVTAGAGVVVE